MAQEEELHRLSLKHRKYEDTAVPPTFNAPDGQVG